MRERLTILDGKELRRSALSIVDEVGTVFFFGDRVLRAIRSEAVQGVRALFASGLPDELFARGWMPRCWESDVSIPGFGLVLEQTRLPVVSYPYEWTYGMLRDAAARVLEINLLARDYGWELKDCHGFNVVFDGSRPMWVDFGSFTPCGRGDEGWPAFEEFMRFYEYPLRIWSHGGGFIAMRLVAVSQLMSHIDYGLYKWPFLRWGGAKVYDRCLRRLYGVRRLTRKSDERFRLRLGTFIGPLVGSLVRRVRLPGLHVSLQAVRTRLIRRRRLYLGGMWSSYQIGAASVATPRFDKIVKLLREFDVGSVVELGGNQGHLSERLLREGVVQSATCTDAEEEVVDRGYERVRGTAIQLSFAVINFVVPMMNPNGSDWPEKRLRADAALALAVTHHLLLTQQIPVERVLRNIAGYAARVAIVEFMPLGLYDGCTAPPIPAWYTLEWFREAFTKEFRILHEELLEPNRYLFCGEPIDIK